MAVEEKAERYIKNGWGELNVGGWRARMKEAFIAGYAEAMQWRDPKEELPDEASCDFCRDEQGYAIGNMYVCDKCGRQVP